MTRRRDPPNPIAKALELTNARGSITVPDLAPRLRLTLFEAYRIMRALTRDGFVVQVGELTFRAIDTTNGDQ